MTKSEIVMIWQRWFKQASDETLVQAFRFTIVGIFAFAIDFAYLTYAVTVLQWNYLISAAVAYLIGLSINYLFCVSWVFSARRFQNQSVEYMLFTVIGVTGLGITEFVLWTGTDLYGLDFRLSKLFSLVIVAGWNFAARKFILFSDFGRAQRV